MGQPRGVTCDRLKREASRLTAGVVGIRFLLVDDEPVLLRALVPHVEPLAGSSGTVESAESPKQALERLAAYPADARVVVVSDFNLHADRTGLQLLEEVAKTRPDALRVLMSGYALDQLGVSVDGSTLHAFIEKPLYLHTLTAQLRGIIASHWA